MVALTFQQTGVERAHDPFAIYDGAQEQEDGVHELDSEESLALLRRQRSWLAQEKSNQHDHRFQMAIDDDFYDHQQWRGEDVQVLHQRNQAPLVFNRTSLAINWLFGTAIQTPVDWRVHPRERDDEAMAPIKTKVMKYVSDVNYATQTRLMSFKDALKAGVGWIDHGVNRDPTAELIRISYENWRNVWGDSKGRHPMLEDWRYQFREKYLDEDVAEAMFPERARLIRESANSNERSGGDDESGWASYENELETGLGSTNMDSTSFSSGVGDALRNQIDVRRRVRVTECWYRVPVSQTLMRGHLFNGREYDPANETMKQAVKDHVCSIVQNVTMKMHYSIWCDAGLLAKGPTPFKHNRFPLVPIFCYRRAKDGAPYGVIRGMRDAQEDYNKRASKALHILSTKGILFEEGAFEDEEEIRDELARTDFMIPYKPGRKIEFVRETSLAQGHIDLMNMDAMHMESASGVTNELVAMQTQAVSGRAIEKRQQQGQLTTSEPFNNYRLALQMSGEIVLSMVEQFVSEPKTFRLTGERNSAEFLDVNQPQFDEASGEWKFLNDITKRQADFVISETDFRESVRQAQAEVTLDFLSKLPGDASIKFFDLAIELMDLPNKTEWLKRARGLSGAPDPDMAKTPEGQQEMERQQQRQQMMDQIEQRTLMAQLEKLEADVTKARAEGKRVDSQAILDRMNAIAKGMEAGATVVTVPGVTPAADVLLDGAGFESAIKGSAPLPPMQATQMMNQPTI